MGTSMARNLHRAGLLYGVWNRTGEKARRWPLNCNARRPLTELARACEVVVICVSADRDVLSVVAAMARPCARARSSSTVNGRRGHAAAGAQLAARGLIPRAR
jgi:3-hydroxyisobutyrate dehydrogenase